MKAKKVDYVRINMSHSTIKDLKDTIKLSKNSGLKYVLDTEGSQIRTRLFLNKSFSLSENDIVKIYNRNILSKTKKPNIHSYNNSFILTPFKAIESISLGDLIHINTFGPIISVVDVSPITSEYIIGKVIHGGKILNNKSVFIDKAFIANDHLSVLSSKDNKAIQLGLNEDVSHIAVSYVRSGSDVDHVRDITQNKMKIISKVENRSALKNLEQIIEKSDFLLFDRGDMSKEVPGEKIPFLQKYILKSCRMKGKGFFVATNLLESMVTNAKPTKAEIHDVAVASLDGVYGLTLSAETAVGEHPFRSINMLNRIIGHVEQIIKTSNNLDFDNNINDFKLPPEYLNDHYVDIPVKPYGGSLIQTNNMDTNYIGAMPKIFVDENAVRDVLQIAIGGYSPLKGFMDEDDLHSVLNKMQLSNGLTWPLPITLDIEKSDTDLISIGQNCCLIDSNNQPVATMEVKQIYKHERQRIAKAIYGTDDAKHLGVKRVINQKPILVAGEITSINPMTQIISGHEYTPRQLRKLFYEKGWLKIAGFHTRNVAHRGHEYILSRVLEDEFCDGVLLHPVIGNKKRGDFNSKYIVKSYEMMIQHYLMKDRFVLSGFGTYSRYAGPREAIFTAICRKNYGCTHFIVGRDHTGIGDYYGSSSSNDVFNIIDDIGIEIISFDEIVYSKKEKSYIETNLMNNKKSISYNKISGTEFRKLLLKNKLPESWMARQKISQMLLDSLSNGEKVFVE